MRRKINLNLPRTDIIVQNERQRNQNSVTVLHVIKKLRGGMKM